MRHTILIDQDGPLADFEKGLYDAIGAIHPEIARVTYQDRRHFKAELDYIYEEHVKKIRKLYRAKGFYENLPIVPGAVQAIEEMHQAGHSVWICSSPLSDYENCVTEKYRWLEKHFGCRWTKRIILTKDKTLVKGSVLVDDRPDPTGVSAPEWIHVLWDAPYNQTYEDSHEYIDKFRLFNWADWGKTLEPIL